MQKFIIKTFGCKTNQIESDIMFENLISNGFSEAMSTIDSDFFIINSCSVTDSADSEALKLLTKIKNLYPSTITVLTGCFAQTGKEKLLAFNNVDIIIGNTDKLDISKYLLEFSAKKIINVKNIFNELEFQFRKVEQPHKTRAFLKIQDGCNNRCTYCTICLARGKSRSAKIDDLISQINIFNNHGFNEIVLTGIHIGLFGEDLTPKLRLIDLLQEIEKTKIKRYRLGSLHPHELTDELLKFLSKSDKFCPHFHLSLQSLNNKTLQAMGRKYSAEKALDLIEKINNHFDLPFIGCDLIVGFPNETEEDFGLTLKNFELAKLTNAHIFPFSARANTPAANMQNQVARALKSQRLNLVKPFAYKKLQNFMNRNLNTIQEVIFENKEHGELDRKPLFKGITRNYLNVFVRGMSDNQDLRGEIKKIIITKIENDVLWGEIV